MNHNFFFYLMYKLQMRMMTKCFFHVVFCFLRIMHDEVSETENIRKNLAIERMIVEGCEILLDTSQTFVRQGNSHL